MELSWKEALVIVVAATGLIGYGVWSCSRGNSGDTVGVRPEAPVNAPGCLRAAAEVISAGRECGLNMSRYSPTKICRSYIEVEKFTDERAVERLRLIMDQDCSGLRAAVDGDRI
jgi:hypothetical protein